MKYRVFGIILITSLILAGFASCGSSKPGAHKPQAEPPLRGVVLILDPGHGDMCEHGMRCPDCAPDPGCWTNTPKGRAWESVFTWDVGMRLRRAALASGAKVFLTLRNPSGDYSPKNWRAWSFPTVANWKARPGQKKFGYRVLVGDPYPKCWQEALRARVEYGNAIYRKYHKEYDVYFISLHFDSTSPRLVGMSFYYSTHQREATGFPAYLLREMRRAHRQRRDLATGREYNVMEAKDYAVLGHSINADSYLVELGNIQSDQEGRNPDLFRMRSPAARQAYANLIVRTLRKYVASKMAVGGR